MSTQKLDPKGLASHHVADLRAKFGQRGPIGKDDSLITIHRNAAQDELINYIERTFIGRTTVC